MLKNYASYCTKIADKNSNHKFPNRLLKIKNGSSFGINKVFDFQPKCQKQIQGETKTHCYKRKVNKRGANDSCTYPQSFGDTSTDFKTAFLEIMQYGIE